MIKQCFGQIRIVTFLVLLGCGSVAKAQKLGFELPNCEARTISVSPHENDLTVVCFLGTECPMARAYAGRLNDLQQEYSDSGVRFVSVMSNRQDSWSDIEVFVRETQAVFEVVKDRDNRVADQYGATRTPEVFLLDSALKLRYHGRVDDQYAPGVAKSSPSREDLRIAIDELLAGKPVSIRETRALGCIIGKHKKGNHVATVTGPAVTYSRDIYPVLQRNCIECHRSGEIGPFAMDSYDEVVGWSDTMMETIDDRRMPPWHADPAFGSFANERIMSQEDKDLFRRWIEIGAPEGDSRDLPPPHEYTSGWQLEREPDVVLSMRERPFTIPKDGVVEYQYFVVDPKFEEDKWVTAAQVIPGARDVVHHAIVFIRPPDGAPFNGVGWLTAYVPGQRALKMQPGRARLIPAGSKLVFQMHYTPVGTERQDVSKVGLLFTDESKVTHSVYTLMAIDQEFEIPPHESSHLVQASLSRLPRSGELLAATPHMHVRGKSFELRGGYASPKEETADHDNDVLLHVPRYDFNWQHTYQFETPLPLDELKSLEFKATFDNSQKNPFNPDASEWVTWGDQTWEEMAIAFFEVAVPRTVDMAARETSSQGPSSSERQAKIEQYVKQVFDKMDTNRDGVIHKSEATIIVRRWNFWRWDLDRDEVATADEIREVAEGLF